MNILITNIGRRGYLVDFIKDTAVIDGKVFVSDCDDTASGLYTSNDGRFILPKPVDDEKKYVNSLIRLCKDKDIKIVFPVIDPEIYILSKYKKLFIKNNIIVVVSTREVLKICNNKLNMNNFLSKNGYLVPKTYISVNDFKKDYDDKKIAFPVLIKPICGSGSANTFKVENMEKLVSLFKDDMMIQELIVGEEYGIDILNSFEGKTVRCVVKKKLLMRSGETDKATTIKDTEIRKLAIKLGTDLGHIGNLDSDLIKTSDGKMYFIDLNPRFGGGYPATHVSGNNYLELIYNMCNGMKVEPNFDDYDYDIVIMKEVRIRTKKKDDLLERY